MRTIIVAAVGRNGIIGVDGGLPWHIPEDMARFRELTMGQTLIMGRETFESIGRPLPGRTTIVLTRTPGWSHEGVAVAGSLDEALARVEEMGTDAWIAGGAGVYAAALDVADRLELTEVAAEPDGDTTFPEVDWAKWSEVSRVQHDGFDFVTYDRS